MTFLVYVGVHFVVNTVEKRIKTVITCLLRIFDGTEKTLIQHS